MILIKPSYDPNRHAEYKEFVLQNFREHPACASLRQKDLDAYIRFANLDLTPADKIMRDCYSKYGPNPRMPSDMLRSLLLCIFRRVSSLTKWAEELKTQPSLAIISGFEPDNVPGVGTFYDFISRLWNADSRSLSPPERPKRRKPDKPSKKGQKAPPLEKKSVKELVQEFQDSPLEL